MRSFSSGLALHSLTTCFHYKEGFTHCDSALHARLLPTPPGLTLCRFWGLRLEQLGPGKTPVYHRDSEEERCKSHRAELMISNNSDIIVMPLATYQKFRTISSTCEEQSNHNLPLHRVLDSLGNVRLGLTSARALLGPARVEQW